MSFQKAPFPDLELIDELLFKPCDFNLKNIEPESESQEYSAHTFQLAEYKVLFRKAKLAPAKTGQFVTLWKGMRKGLRNLLPMQTNLPFI